MIYLASLLGPYIFHSPSSQITQQSTGFHQITNESLNTSM